jgi:hypothetical protein
LKEAIELIEELGEDHESQILHVGCARDVDELQHYLQKETMIHLAIAAAKRAELDLNLKQPALH